MSNQGKQTTASTSKGTLTCITAHALANKPIGYIGHPEFHRSRISPTNTHTRRKRGRAQEWVKNQVISPGRGVVSIQIIDGKEKTHFTYSPTYSNTLLGAKEESDLRSIP